MRHSIFLDCNSSFVPLVCQVSSAAAMNRPLDHAREIAFKNAEDIRYQIEHGWSKFKAQVRLFFRNCLETVSLLAL